MYVNFGRLMSTKETTSEPIRKQEENINTHLKYSDPGTESSGGFL
jgi:hypothetical protein